MCALPAGAFEAGNSCSGGDAQGVTRTRRGAPQLSGRFGLTSGGRRWRLGSRRSLWGSARRRPRWGLRGCGGKVGLRYSLTAPFLPERTALFIPGAPGVGSATIISPPPPGRAWRKGMAFLARPRMLSGFVRTALRPEGPVSGWDSGGSEGNGTHTLTTTSSSILLPFIFIFGRRCEIFDWLAG